MDEQHPSTGKIASDEPYAGLLAQKLSAYRAGAELLERWLRDQMVFGLAAVESDPEGRLEQIAAQLTDAQLPAPASALRGLKRVVGVHADWPERIFAEFGYWYTLCRLLRRPEQLTREQLGGTLAAFGLNLRRAKVLEEGPQRLDTWTCVGRETGSDEQLHFRRTYWMGTVPDAYGVQLEFSYGSPPAPSLVETGAQAEFAMRIYPAGLPGRVALPERFSVVTATEPPPCHADWATQVDADVRLVVRQPWRRELPVAVGGLSPGLRGDQLWLSDAGGEARAVDAGPDDRPAWRLHALAGGRPCVVYGVQRAGGHLALLSAWVDGRLYALSR